MENYSQDRSYNSASITRQTTLRVPTAEAGAIEVCAERLLDAAWDQRRPLRLIGVGAHNLVENSQEWQLELSLV